MAVWSLKRRRVAFQLVLFTQPAPYVTGLSRPRHACFERLGYSFEASSVITEHSFEVFNSDRVELVVESHDLDLEIDLVIQARCQSVPRALALSIPAFWRCRMKLRSSSATMPSIASLMGKMARR